MIRLVHIINPVVVPESSDLYLAQPITFESMKRAKEMTELECPDIKIELLSCQYEEDESFVPSYLRKTPNLERSVRDLDTFSRAKKLPFISDILNRAYQHSEADYVVFTNVDISLYPRFYTKVASYIKNGFDGICINRNTLPNGEYQAGDLSELIELAGKPHEGIDCFVFKRAWIPKMQLGDSIVGTGPVGLILAMNLLRLSKSFKWIREGKFTFHIGDDKTWLSKKVKEDSALYFNNNQLNQIVKKLLETTEKKNQKMVLQATQNHINFFLSTLTFLPKPFHRDILALYSDNNIAAIKKLLKKQQDVMQDRSWNSENKSRTFIIDKIKHMLKK